MHLFNSTLLINACVPLFYVHPFILSILFQCIHTWRIFFRCYRYGNVQNHKMQIQCCNLIFLSQNDAPQIVLLNHVVLKTCSFEQQINFSGWTTGKSYLCMYVCICLCLVVIYFRHLGEAKVLIGVWLHRTNKKDFLHFVWLCLDATVLTQLLQYEQRKFKTQV